MIAKNHKEFNQERHFPGLNPGPFIYVYTVINTWLRRSKDVNLSRHLFSIYHCRYMQEALGPKPVLLTLTLLTWRICWAANNASRWQMGFNSAFKGL